MPPRFTLDDFRDQMLKYSRPGLWTRLALALPGMGEARRQADEEWLQTQRMVGIVDSMTSAERRQPSLLDPSRHDRIAHGAGVSAVEVRQLIKHFESMVPIMQACKMAGLRGRVRAIKQVQEYGYLPYAEPAPEGCPRCLACGLQFEEGRLRIVISQEVDVRRRVSRRPGYLHPSCCSDYQSLPDNLLEQILAYSSWLTSAELAELKRDLGT